MLVCMIEADVVNQFNIFVKQTIILAPSAPVIPFSLHLSGVSPGKHVDAPSNFV